MLTFLHLSKTMDLWSSIPILYLLLLSSQMTSGGSPASKGVADISAVEPHDIMEPDGHHEPDSEDVVRLLLMALQSNNYRPPHPHWRNHNFVGIPFRPVRRLGSEFLGKRSDPQFGDEFEESENIEKRARMGSEFLGKRRMGSEFLGKRRMGSEFLGKRGMGSEFLGKRGMGSEFLGKRRMGSEFLGKRRMGSEFLGKRRMGSEFLGKRRMGSEFLGKRKLGSEFLGKRVYEPQGHLELSPLSPESFLQLSSHESDDLDDHQPGIILPSVDLLLRPQPFDDSVQLAKRGLGSEFLGKRKPNMYDFSFKRGRLGSEFLGKRSAEPELAYPYLQTDRDLQQLKSSSGSSTSSQDNSEDTTEK